MPDGERSPATARETIYRDFGIAFTGTRPTLRLGDPGIDAAWMRRYRLGVVGTALWYLLTTVGMGMGFFSAWGPFGWVDTWQLVTFGSNNVILLTILFMPLTFLPMLIARPTRIDGSTPIRLGMRQAFDGKWGPRVLGKTGSEGARIRRLSLVSRAIAGLGALGLAIFVAKGIHDARAPHAPLTEIGYAALVGPQGPLPRSAHVTGVVADRSRGWVHDYTIRYDRHRDVYYPLRPPGAAVTDPVQLVEVDRIAPTDAAAVWNMVDPPGPREGRLELLDDWTRSSLLSAGVLVGPRVVLLKREHLEGKVPEPDPVDDFVYGSFALTALFVGSLLWWSTTRAQRQAMRSIKN